MTGQKVANLIALSEVSSGVDFGEKSVIAKLDRDLNMTRFHENTHSSLSAWPMEMLGHQHIVIEPFEIQTRAQRSEFDKDGDDRIGPTMLVFGLKLALCIAQLYATFTAVD